MLSAYQNEILGGMLIGLGSAIPMLVEGRIAGISGYAASAMRPKNNEGKTGLVLILGIVLGAFIWRVLGQEITSSYAINVPIWLWPLAGLLVGFGSRLGGGCTSGHGVCGLGRASPRSFVSVLIFMGVAILTTILMRSLS